MRVRCGKLGLVVLGGRAVGVFSDLIWQTAEIWAAAVMGGFSMLLIIVFFILSALSPNQPEPDKEQLPTKEKAGSPQKEKTTSREMEDKPVNSRSFDSLEVNPLDISDYTMDAILGREPKKEVEEPKSVNEPVTRDDS